MKHHLPTFTFFLALSNTVLLAYVVNHLLRQSNSNELQTKLGKLNKRIEQLHNLQENNSSKGKPTTIEIKKETAVLEKKAAAIITEKYSQTLAPIKASLLETTMKARKFLFKDKQ